MAAYGRVFVERRGGARSFAGIQHGYRRRSRSQFFMTADIELQNEDRGVRRVVCVERTGSRSVFRVAGWLSRSVHSHFHGRSQFFVAISVERRVSDIESL